MEGMLNVIYMGIMIIYYIEMYIYIYTLHYKF